MIKKLRRKFILISMLSTFAVLFLIIGSLNLANYISMTQNADRLLDYLIDSGGEFKADFMGKPLEFNGDISFAPAPPDKNFERNFKNPKFSFETPYETIFFSVRYASNDKNDINKYVPFAGRIASVSEDEAKEYAKKAVKGNGLYAKKRGYIGNYRYAISSVKNDSFVVFIDRTREIQSFHNVLKYSIILSAVGLLAVYFLVYFISKKVFKPVEESYEKQKRFVTDASHELKTPLTIISANTEIIEMENNENDWTKSIKNQVARMTSLTEKMVMLSRMDENEALSFAKINLSKIINESIDNYTVLAKQKSIDFKYDIEDSIYMSADEAKICQMISLLLDNSLKYATPVSSKLSDKEQNAWISVTLKKMGNRIHLSISNSADMPSDGNMNILFERFYRLDSSRNSKTGGSGIGLSIVESIVDAHKGTINAKAIKGESIEFNISFKAVQ
ncbi:MAG: HAMP domain-containing histidine kinase [Lachnospiraceae bacterium]|nr:HAMP domain-containing histidine kinase [Lachnospiraceae bacterium]